MLAFITTLRHPQNSADYARVEDLLADTLRSVTAQTSEDYVVLVVGNRRPAFELPVHTHFVPVDFPAPAPPDGPRTAREPFIWDKGTKVGIGLLAARRWNPDHVMIFDADDFVHRDLAAFVADRPGTPGWVIEEGWRYSRARNVMRHQPIFNRRCGTSYIIPFEAYDVPADLDETASQEQVAAGFGDRLGSIMGAHRDAVAWHATHGRTLEPLPFRGAVYHVDTGENHSGSNLRGIAAPLSPRLADEFGITPSLGRAATAWRAYGPTALVQSALSAANRVRVRLVGALRRRG